MADSTNQEATQDVGGNQVANLLNIRRTGWENYDRGTFVETLPQDDTRQHSLGDECWCQPRVERETKKTRPYIVHNSADRREDNE